MGEVLINKSVTNWISYLHKVSQIFFPDPTYFLTGKTVFGFICKLEKRRQVGPTCRLRGRPTLAPRWKQIWCGPSVKR
jgi:hypothetical protein